MTNRARFIVNGTVFFTKEDAEAYAEKLMKEQILNAYREEIKASNLSDGLKKHLLEGDLLV